MCTILKKDKMNQLAERPDLAQLSSSCMESVHLWRFFQAMHWALANVIWCHLHWFLFQKLIFLLSLVSLFAKGKQMIDILNEFQIDAAAIGINLIQYF